MADDSKMLWSRTDVMEDFDDKILVLARLRPLSGKGFYTVLRNLIYLRAPEPFSLDKWAWDRLKVVMPIPRKQFDAMLGMLLEIELFDKTHYEKTGELTSKRIRMEIAGRFGDQVRAKRYRDSHRDAGCDDDRDSHRFVDAHSNGESNGYSKHITGNRKQKTGRHSAAHPSRRSNGSRSDAEIAAQNDRQCLVADARKRLNAKGLAITPETIDAEIEAMKGEG